MLRNLFDVDVVVSCGKSTVHCPRKNHISLNPQMHPEQEYATFLGIINFFECFGWNVEESIIFYFMS